MPLPRFRRRVRTGRRVVARRVTAAMTAAACLTVVAAFAASSRGQAAPALPFDVTAPTLASTAPIAQYIDRAVTDFRSGDRDKVMGARNALIAPIAPRVVQQTPPSQAFLAAYAVELNRRLTAVADAKDPHASLNAALVVIRAAEVSRAPSLAPLIARLIGDDSPAIASFGLRAAGEVIVSTLATSNAARDDVLVPAILKAVEQSPESPSVVFDAYQAFTSVILNRAASDTIPPALIAGATPRLVDAVQSLLDIRLRQYAAGNIVEPAAEQAGLSFLSRQATWAASTAAQKGKSVQAMMQVANAAAAELEGDQSNAAKNRPRQEALRNAVKGAAQGLSVIANLESKNDLFAATAAIKALGQASPASEYRNATNRLLAEAGKAFPNLAATTAPATAPSTP